MAVVGGEPIEISITLENEALVRLAESSGRFEETVEHGWQVEGRAADHLEHVGGRGLLLQGFPQLVEQAGVLDGYDGLLRETADQLDLLVREGTSFLAIDANRADQLLVLEHRHYEQCPDAAKLDAGNRQRVAFAIGPVGRIIDHMQNVAALDHATDRVERSGTMRLAPQELGKSGWYVEARHDPGTAILEPEQGCEPRLAYVRRVAQDRLEHGLQLAG